MKDKHMGIMAIEMELHEYYYDDNIANLNVIRPLLSNTL